MEKEKHLKHPWKNIWKDLIGSKTFSKPFTDKDVFIFVVEE